MLEMMRKNVSSFIIKGIISLVVLSFIGTIFLVWGVGDRPEQKGQSIARVLGEDIPYSEYVSEYEQLHNYYRNQFKDKWSKDTAEKLQLKKMALDNIVNRRLLLHEAQEQGLEVTEEEVMNKIEEMPMFQQNGHFDAQLYARLLEYHLHMSALSFEDQIKKGMIIDRLTDRLKSGIKISSKEVLDAYTERNEKIQAEYILISGNLSTEEITITDEEIRTFFDQHASDYQLLEKRNVQYIYINSHDFKSDLTIDELSLQQYYNAHKNQYTLPKQVRARHILKRSSPQDTPEQKVELKTKMDEILAKIKGGENFAELAQKTSDDPGSADKGGDLGYFSKGRMTAAFEKVAFALAKGEVSEVVETPFGYHIIMVEDIIEERTKPLEEMRPQIENNLREEKALEVAENEAFNLVRNFYKEGKFEELANKSNYPLNQTEISQDTKTIPGIGPSGDLVKAAFKLKGKEEISSPVQANTGFYVLRLMEIIAPKVPDLEQVKEKVAEAVKKEKKENRAKDLAQELAAKLQKGEATLAGLAEEHQLTVMDTGEIAQFDYIKGLGSNQELTKALFSLKEGEYTSPISTQRGYCLALLKKRIPVDLNKFKEEEAAMRQQFLMVKEQEIVNVWLDRLKKKNNIAVDYNKI